MITKDAHEMVSDLLYINMAKNQIKLIAIYSLENCC